ncbi:hypothetical protein BC826DRAFT_1050507 [Russula brevipes]|nr:hypothetical protein BC826DRAFT_1050507 [Russula brevipes]
MGNCFPSPHRDNEVPLHGLIQSSPPPPESSSIPPSPDGSRKSTHLNRVETAASFMPGATAGTTAVIFVNMQQSPQRRHTMPVQGTPQRPALVPAFTPTMGNLRYAPGHSEILVIGKSLCGKSSLINSIFKVDPSTDESRTVDVDSGFVHVTSRNNRHHIVHECSEIAQNIQIIREFITGRTGPNFPASEKLHAIWICVPTQDVVDRNIGDGVEEPAMVVPVVLVATKFDLVVSQVPADIAGDAARHYENARARARATYKRTCRSLLPSNLKDVPAEAVSTDPRFSDLIHRGNPQISPVPLVWSIAQRIIHNLIIQASIELCGVIHVDIVDVWNLRDRDGYLRGREFKTKMSNLVKDSAELLPTGASPSYATVPALMTGGWATNSYQNSAEHIRYIMGYIVDLTVILHRFFISAHDVSTSEVQATMNLHVRSGLREQIHGDIHRFVTVLASLPHHGNDLAMEKIIDLIRQFCVPPLLGSECQESFPDYLRESRQ